MAIRQVIIYTEDSYGVAFFKKLIERLVKEKFIDISLNVETKRLAGKCYLKSGRQIVTSIEFYDRIIVVIDAEGKNKKTVKVNDLEKHVFNHIKHRVQKDHINKFKNKIKDKLKIIVLDYMIEEWICYSLGIKVRNKPSEDLNGWLRKYKSYKHGYKKSTLPYFVYGEKSYPKINLKALMNYPTFKEFISALKE